jgi:plasmid stability protein
MPTLTVRNVAQATIDRLKAQAKAHERSLEAEIRRILDEIAQRPDTTEIAREVRAIHDRILARRGEPAATDSTRMLHGERERL